MIVFEDNDDMLRTYLMFDPAGRWMTDGGGVKRFRPFRELLEGGMGTVLDVGRYYARGAVYEW